MASDRYHAVKDVQSDMVPFGSTEQYLSQHLNPEVGGLNVRQSEGIMYAMEAIRRIHIALTQIDKDIQRLEEVVNDKQIHLEVGDASILLKRSGEITLSTGDSSISMKKDGSITIRGQDITIVGAGQVQIRASKDLTLKGQKIHEN